MEKPNGYKYAKAQIKVLWNWIDSLLVTLSKGDQKIIETAKKQIRYQIWEEIHENQD